MGELIKLEDKLEYRQYLNDLHIALISAQSRFIDKLTLEQYKRFVAALKTSEGVVIEKITKDKDIIALYERRQELNNKLDIINGRRKQVNLLDGGLKLVG